MNEYLSNCWSCEKLSQVEIDYLVNSNYCVLFYILQSNRCYCISNKHHELFNTWGGVPYKRNVTSLCNLPCPGDDDDRCGSLEKPSSESEIILTVYIYVQEQIGKYTIDLIYWWLLTSREHLYWWQSITYLMNILNGIVFIDVVEKIYK